MIPINGLHIEPTNICTLKCSECSRTKFINQWPQHWHNHQLNIDQLLDFLDIDLSNMPILLCGNYGDPIYHSDFINFIKKLKARGPYINIVTNGSYKKESWWQELTDILTDKDLVTFSIDGTPENFSLYRINGDWDSIKTGIDVCVKSQCQTEWKYIPFGYNIETIDQARALSNSMGIDIFTLRPSNRFDNLVPAHLQVSDPKYLRSTYQSQIQWKTLNKKPDKINPECYTGQSHYISADGYYSSCCKINDFSFYYKSHFGKNRKNYQIQNTTLSKILSNPDTINFYQEILVNPEPACQFQCPAVDQ